MKRNDLSRYRELVDKKFLHGLTSQEKNELSRLAAKIDKTHESFYRPILVWAAQLGMVYRAIAQRGSK